MLVSDVFALTHPGHAGVASTGSQNDRGLTAITLVVRLTLLAFECRDKSPALFSKYAGLSPEETVGVLSRTFFCWLASLMALGNKRILRPGDIPPLDTQLRGTKRREQVLKHWESREQPADSATLLRVLARCLMAHTLHPILPRLCVTFFRCSQPVLIRQAMAFVSGTNEHAECHGNWILSAAIVIYGGLAVCTSLYRHRLNRLQIGIRASLVALVYDKALKISSDVFDANRVVTIMGTDIDSVSGAGEMLHETWGQFAELATGMILLAREVKWLWPLPLAIIVASSRVSKYVAANIRMRQKNWTAATQTRISTLSSTLGSMKSVMAMGLAGHLGDYITDLRQAEIESSKDVRWMNCIYNASANAVGIFTPVITVVLFALVAAAQGVQLDAKTTFTTTAILAVVTHPANMIMTIVPRAIAALANLERIQAYLLEPNRIDERRVVERGDQQGRPAAIQMSSVHVQFETRDTPTLQDIELTVPHGFLTVCCGPTGCGKSTLAKVILGEVSPIGGSCEVSSRRIGYCDQKPWIPTGKLRDIVCGFADAIDQRLSWDAMRACCLDHDLGRLPDRDETVVGSRGINMSGGQRQRLALARVLYSRASIVVLDDPFSGLDGSTENTVVDNLLGPKGWFRRFGTTVFVIGHSGRHFDAADRIVVLGDGRIIAQGPPAAISGFVARAQKISLENQQTDKRDWDASLLVKRVDDPEDDLHRKAGDASLYAYYIKSAGFGNLATLVACTASYSFFSTFLQYWFKWWTTDSGNTAVYISGYMLFAFAAWVSTSAQMWVTFILLAPRSGHMLHQALLVSIFGAPLSYFVSTGTGVTLNRFSQDISLVDRQLPVALSGLCTQILKMTVQLAILLQVQRQLWLSLPVCIAVVYVVQRVYLRTSRQLRALELESHSALYSWFLETVDGVVSIRCFGWQASATAMNLEGLDSSARPEYALMCLQCWLNLVLDLLVGLVAVGVIAVALRWRDTKGEANLGMSLNIILVTSPTLVRLVQSWTSLEVSLRAVARLKSAIEETPSEDKPGEELKPDAWPTRGDLRVRHLSAGYDLNNMVLTGVDLDASPGQKLVICGRTGSGKSTIVLSLLWLIESSGSINVDGVPLSRIRRSAIRDQCFITVPQDAFFLPQATLQFNLDPSGRVPRSILRDALLSVDMWVPVSAVSPGADPFDQPMSSLPSFSVGQTQLLAMARAVVKRHALAGAGEYHDDEPCRPILLLDEATSSLDAATEAKIYDIHTGEADAAWRPRRLDSRRASGQGGQR
ncbi:ABC multidrug transporter [Purpureocillium lilacinum]|uniref:ABC multidrug transporter n=1 Tax=Purpureocillium lilacinum TaxID=33203 RepID=A0A179G1E7_PURLI|nr:ABC multidrug transporter [Purpureocillium lilacinum]